MAKRVCIEDGCPTLTDKTRCTQHERARDKARGTRQQRGYGAEHTQLRAAYQRDMDGGHLYACWRCGRTVDPRSWHLGHDDHDRSQYRGPECVACNTPTASRRR